MGHDIGKLVAEAKDAGVSVLERVDDNSYDISRWETTIRYNSSFRTNRDAIVNYNGFTEEWLRSFINQ